MPADKSRATSFQEASLQSTGSLAAMRLEKLLEEARLQRATGILSVRDNGRACTFYFLFGGLYHAVGAGITGDAVVVDALGWDSGDFSFDAKAQLSGDKTVSLAIPDLIKKARAARRQAAVFARSTELELPAGTPPASAPAGGSSFAAVSEQSVGRLFAINLFVSICAPFLALLLLCAPFLALLLLGEVPVRRALDILMVSSVASSVAVIVAFFLVLDVDGAAGELRRLWTLVWLSRRGDEARAELVDVSRFHRLHTARYRYEYAGKQYFLKHKADYWRFATRHGKHVIVLVDPERPQNAVILRRADA